MNYVWPAIAALSTLNTLLLLYMLARQSRRHSGQIDRLLLLGKSSSVGEAVSAYERLNRLERARAELEAQRERARPGVYVRGAEGEPGSDGTDVARKADPGRNWFGSRQPPKPRTEG